MDKDTMILAAVQMATLNFPRAVEAENVKNYDDALQKKIAENYEWLEKFSKSKIPKGTVRVGKIKGL